MWSLPLLNYLYTFDKKTTTRHDSIFCPLHITSTLRNGLFQSIYDYFSHSCYLIVTHLCRLLFSHIYSKILF